MKKLRKDSIVFQNSAVAGVAEGLMSGGITAALMGTVTAGIGLWIQAKLEDRYIGTTDEAKEHIDQTASKFDKMSIHK